MTLPLVLALHVVYGAAMAYVFLPRLEREQELLGAPLLLVFAPVFLLSAPIAFVQLRYSGGWFLHGAFLGGNSIPYERFHVGYALAMLALIVVATAVAWIVSLFFLSRGRRRAAQLPFALAAIASVAIVALDGKNIVSIAGTQGRHLWSHPTGVPSLAMGLCLFGYGTLAKQRFAKVSLSPRDVTPVILPELLGAGDTPSNAA
jgi:hypothetical protein